MFISIMVPVLFVDVYADDKDLFSSTEDMKRLFAKEEQLRGSIAQR